MYQIYKCQDCGKEFAVEEGQTKPECCPWCKSVTIRKGKFFYSHRRQADEPVRKDYRGLPW